MSVEEEVKERLKNKRTKEREQHVAGDGQYARLPTGYKKALGETVETVNRPRFEPRHL
jgi:hypothetical protein